MSFRYSLRDTVLTTSQYLGRVNDKTTGDGRTSRSKEVSWRGLPGPTPCVTTSPVRLARALTRYTVDLWQSR